MNVANNPRWRGQQQQQGRGNRPQHPPPPHRIDPGRGPPQQPPNFRPGNNPNFQMGPPVGRFPHPSGRGNFVGAPGRGPMGRGPPPPPPSRRMDLPQMFHAPARAPLHMGRPPMRGPPPPPPMHHGNQPFHPRTPMGPPHHGISIPPPPPPPPPRLQNQSAGRPPATFPIHSKLNQRHPPSAGHVPPQSRHPPPVGVVVPQPYSQTNAPQPIGHPSQQPVGQPTIPPPPPPPPPQPAASTPLTEDEAWTEHKAPNNMKYYYNSITKKSEWEKPQALKEKEAGKLWKKYTEATTGQTYYSDGVNTTWDKPPGFEDEPEEKVEQPKKKRKVSPVEKTFASKAEAVAAFKDLLVTRDISSTMKWNEVVKLVSSDSRWDECDSALTAGERRQALAEYQTKRTSELKLRERQERQRSRESFNRLLAEKLTGRAPWNIRFEEIRESLVPDDRFHAVADEASRETLFQEFCEENRKREERKQRNRRNELQQSFNSFLDDKQQAGKLTSNTSWTEFLSTLEKSELDDSRVAVSSDLGEADRRTFFDEYVADLQSKKEAELQRIEKEKRQTEKDQIAAFIASLVTLAKAGKLLPSSRWRTSEALLNKESTLEPLLQQERGMPQIAFDDFIEEWNSVYRRDRDFLSRLVSDAHPSIAVDQDTTYETFNTNLLNQADESSVTRESIQSILDHAEPVSSAKLYFDELKLQSKSQPTVRRGSMRRHDYESSEDEGEIIEME